MVQFFQPRGYGPGKEDNLIYMGRDKYENEDLIKYGLPHDVWFHVDNLSSAHVYLRLPAGQTIDSISQESLEDCVQLVKANSIQGHKEPTVDVVYTPWANLKKTAAMDVGQVSFHDHKKVKKVTLVKRQADVINRMNKTKREEFPDLAAEREAWDREQRSARKAELQATSRQEKVDRDEKKRQEELKSYKALMQDDQMVTRSEMAEKYATPQDYEDDFM